MNSPKTTAILEHTNIKLKNTHTRDKCKGEYCTIHKRSNHSMREFPQHWRGDRGIMERICTHGVGHVDPDEITDDRTHGCDGCCGEQLAPLSKSQIRRITKVKSDELRKKEL